MAEIRYNFANIRVLLKEGFSDQELRELCFDVPGLRPVYAELAANTGRAEIVSKILEFADRQGQFEALLEEAKKRNPDRYKTEAPYYQGDPSEGLQERVADLTNRLAEVASRTSRLSREDQYKTAYHWVELGRQYSLSPQPTNLSRADLNEANLKRAILKGVNLSQANLRKANLSEAKLESSDEVFDQKTDLSEANLSGANLSEASLESVNLFGVIHDENTVWPKALILTS